MKIAFPTDEHIPFQDDKARQLALKIVSEFQPDLRIAGSDALDFYGISHFDHNPKRISSLQKELDLWKKAQREWKDAAPDARAVFLIGNHEDRLRKYLWKHPELAGLEALETKNLLSFEELGIEFKEGENANLEIVLDGLVIKHGNYIRKFSGYSAKAELDNERYAVSILTGHSHRGGSYYARTRDGLIQAHECFCLCSLEPEYTQHPDWHQGIVLASTNPLNIEMIPFFDFPVHAHGAGRRRKVAIWRGKEYSA